MGDSLIWSSCSLGHSYRATWCCATPERTAGSVSVVSSCSWLLIIISQPSPESHTYAPLETFCPSYSKSLLTVVSTHCSSCHLNKNWRWYKQQQLGTWLTKGHCSLRLMCYTTMASNYSFVASLGRHNGCVQVLANISNSSSGLRQPSNAVWRTAIHMEKEVETWDSALLACAIRNDSVYLGTNIRCLFKLYISSGMILSWLSLTHINDMRECSR